jgi:hypothetical protein
MTKLAFRFSGRAGNQVRSENGARTAQQNRSTCPVGLQTDRRRESSVKNRRAKFSRSTVASARPGGTATVSCS